MKKKGIYTLGEEIGNSVTHGFGVALGIVAMVLLVIRAARHDELSVISVVIFSSSIIVLYLMSTLYHALRVGTAKNVFQRFDHLAIYVLVAGTFAPFLLSVIGGTLGLVLFIVQWSLVIVGIVFKSIWVNKYTHVHTALFLIMGWSGIFLIKPIYHTSVASLVFLLVGGACYSIGVIFFVFKLFKFDHMIWHFFVLFGSLLHFFSVYFIV